MITIGTDCSGIEAPVQALQQLGIPFEHKWSCEIDKFARQSILANYHPEILYEDITKRDHSQLPDVDIYVCGFPCQSFSLMGKKGGTKDPRSNIMLHCIKVIEEKKPPVFILENVKNFKFIEGGKPFNYLMSELSGVKDEDGQPLYSMYADIYNTKDYGIPQNRERLYIVGISNQVMLSPYSKPPIHNVAALGQFLLQHTRSQDKINNKNVLTNLASLARKTNEMSIVTSDRFFYPIPGLCPTLTTKCSNFYVSILNRKLFPEECLLLQGFDRSFRKVVSNTQLYKQIGNSMSVNVLKAIFTIVFECTSLQFIVESSR